jgi:hypothetical protein
MKTQLIIGMFALGLGSSVAAARETTAPDIVKDSRAAVTEQMSPDRRTFEDFTCNSGHAVGWVAAFAGLGLLARRRARAH